MDVVVLLDKIQTIARTGLHYTSNPYDRDRYERLLTIATETYSHILELPEVTIQSRFARELGYITAKVGADAAIFNERGEILLMDRADGTGWCLPCGWVEPNEKPAETVVREVREETGLDVEVTRLVGLFTRMSGMNNGCHAMVATVHLCRIVGGVLMPSHEGRSLGFRPIDEVTRWHASHERHARAAHRMWRTEGMLPAVSD